MIASIRQHFNNFISQDKNRTPTKIELFIEGIKFGKSDKIEKLKAENKKLKECVMACAHISFYCDYGEHISEHAIKLARKTLEQLDGEE